MWFNMAPNTKTREISFQLKKDWNACSMHDDNSKIHSPHNLEGLAWPLNEHENPLPDSGQGTYLSSKKYEESGYGLNLDVLTISCSVIREIFGHNHWLRSILVYASPTGYMLTSSGFTLWNWGILNKFLLNDRQVPAILNYFNRLFLKLNRFICNYCRFSPIIACANSIMRLVSSGSGLSGKKEVTI